MPQRIAVRPRQDEAVAAGLQSLVAAGRRWSPSDFIVNENGKKIRWISGQGAILKYRIEQESAEAQRRRLVSFDKKV